MNTAALIDRATAEGLTFHVAEAGELRVRGSAAVLRRWLPALKREKAAILTALRDRPDLRTKPDWPAAYQARLADGREDGGLTGAAAQANAYACCIAHWLDHTFEGSGADACALGQECRRPHSRLVPFGLEATGQVWLHPECRPLWAARRRMAAVKALKTAGVNAPAKFAEGFGKKGDR